jgi:hypothetical protein
MIEEKPPNGIIKDLKEEPVRTAGQARNAEKVICDIKQWI